MEALETLEISQVFVSQVFAEFTTNVPLVKSVLFAHCVHELPFCENSNALNEPVKEEYEPVEEFVEQKRKVS